MSNKIKIDLTRKKWQEVSELFQKIVTHTPIANLETESCLLSEYFYSHIQKFTLFIPNKSNLLSFSFKKSEAYALYYCLVDQRLGQFDPTTIYLITLLSQQLKIQ